MVLGQLGLDRAASFVIILLLYHSSHLDALEMLFGMTRDSMLQLHMSMFCASAYWFSGACEDARQNLGSRVR